MSQVKYFKILTTAPDPLIKFYYDTLKLEVQKRQIESNEWELCTANEGLADPVSVPNEQDRESGPMIEVSDMDAAMILVESNGGKVIMPVTFEGGPGVVAYCKDPQENTFTLYQKDAHWD